MKEIGPDFFERDPVSCARELIGCLFRWNGCSARIVETEAYAAVGDPACHTWNRPGARRFVESHSAGTAYVYMNYGVHWLFNVLVKGGEEDGFVLFRALEPVEGIGTMLERRGSREISCLCSGPGKLTQSLGIGKEAHGLDFLKKEQTGIVSGNAVSVCDGPRIGISRAKELPWRFGESFSASLSRKFPDAGTDPER